MSTTKSNFDRLHDAGVIDATKFSEQDKKVLDKLTTEETDVLIKLKQKMGSAPIGQAHLQPNFPV